MTDVRRREFITLLGGVAAAWPLAARAQQPAVPVIGFLGSSSAQVTVKSLEAFHKGLSETGHVEGRNVAIEFRWAEGQNDRLPAQSADLVRRQVDVIVATGGAPRLPPRLRPQKFQLSSPAAETRSHLVWSPVSTGRVATPQG